MKRVLVVTVVFAAVMVAIAGMASATVVNVASWRCGENDASPGPNYLGEQAADLTAVDGTGNGHNLTNSGTVAFYEMPSAYPGGLPSYTSTYSPSGALSSAVNLAWAPGSGAYTSTEPIASAIGTDNWGMQCWVRPNSLDTMTYLSAGVWPADITLFQLDAAALGEGWGTGVQYFVETSTGFIAEGGAVDMTRWHNLAVVCDGGTISFYVDGAVKASAPGLAGGITSDFLTLGSSTMLGGIDEARIFTFAPGAFRVSDLGLVPEPGTLTLLATGAFGLLAYAWRKRK